MAQDELTGVTLLADTLLGLVRVQVLLGVESRLAQVFEVCHIVQLSI